MNFSTNLTGYHTLVTGGTKGIGRVIVEYFLAQGANVSYSSRSARGDEFDGFDGASHGARAVGTRLDITNVGDIAEWVEKAEKNFGRIDTVVANAPTGALEPTHGDWEKGVLGDILGLRSLIIATTPHLEKRAAAGGSASLVIISSLAGLESRFPIIGSPYTTVKRAQVVLAKDLSRELGPKGIRINSITPGSIETKNITHTDGTIEESTFQTIMRQHPEFCETLKAQTALKRFGKPEEIANVVLFLASPLASFITGANFVVDGGASTSL